MNIFYAIVFIIILIYFTLRILIKLLFSNPRISHHKTPKDLGLAFSEVRCLTRNDRKIYGWWVPADHSPEAATVILVHGWGRNVERMLDFVENLHPQGCNLLSFDARNHGSSEKDDYATMLKFAEDIQAVIDYIFAEKEIDKEKLFVVGHSIGGAASIYAAAHDSRIKKVVAIGAFAHPKEVMKLTLKEKHVPAFLSPILFKYVESKIGKTLDNIAPQNNIADVEAKILLIHGKKDKVVPFFQAEINLQRGRKDKVRLWALEDIGHSNYGRQGNFWQGIEKFLCENGQN